MIKTLNSLIQSLNENNKCWKLTIAGGHKSQDKTIYFETGDNEAVLNSCYVVLYNQDALKVIKKNLSLPNNNDNTNVNCKFS